MFPNNPYFLEKMVQTKQEEIQRAHRGFNEQQMWNSNDPSNKLSTKSKALRGISLLVALAWLFSLIV